MEDMEVERLRDCLRQWHAPLRELGSLRPSHTSGSSDRALWLHAAYKMRDPNERGVWVDPRTQRRLCQHTLEGLCVLTMLARVDESLFLREIKEIWSQDKDLCRWVDEVLWSSSRHETEPFVVGFSWIAASPANVFKLTYSIRHWNNNSSKLFKHAVRLLKLDTSLGSGFKVPMRLGFDFVLRDEPATVAMAFEAIAEVLRSQGSSSYSAYDHELVSVEGDLRVEGSPWVVVDGEELPKERLYTGIQLNIVRLVHVSAMVRGMDVRGLEALTKLGEFGVEIDELPDLDWNLFRQKDDQVTTNLQALVNRSSVKSVIVSQRNDSRELAEAILSAALYMPSVRAIRLRMCGPGDYHPELWQSITRAVFSKHSAKSFDSLQLDLRYFDQDDLKNIEDVLAEEEVTVVNNYFRANGGRYLTARRFVLTNPVRRIESKAKVERPSTEEKVFLSAAPMSVRVLDGVDGEWRAVLLPGRGQAWVQVADVLATSEPNPAESILDTSKPSFPEIVVGLMTDTTMPYVASLIQLIGYKTRKVSFSNHFTEELTVTIIDGSPYYSIQRDSECPSITEWTHRVLTACPELDEFAFDCPKFDTLQQFVDSAVSGASHLRCLSVASIPMLPDGYIQDFFRALADPNHLLAVYLQELKLTFKITSTNTGAIHLPIQEMLQENRRLRKIKLTFDLQNNLRHLETSIHDAFEELCKEERWIRIGSVPLRNKLAFVSILQVNHGFMELDSSVVGAIFDLAAPGARRELNVEVRIRSAN